MRYLKASAPEFVKHRIHETRLVDVDSYRQMQSLFKPQGGVSTQRNLNGERRAFRHATTTLRIMRISSTIGIQSRIITIRCTRAKLFTATMKRPQHTQSTHIDLASVAAAIAQPLRRSLCPD
jgi:hypothetical protein